MKDYDMSGIENAVKKALEAGVDSGAIKDCVKALLKDTDDADAKKKESDESKDFAKSLGLPGFVD